MTRLTHLLTVIPLSLLFVGCHTDTRPFVQPVVILSEDSYTHAGSGMRFPIVAGELRRSVILQLDREGLEIGAEYALPSPPGMLSASVYVYPAIAVPPVGAPPGTISGNGALLAKNEFEKRKLMVLSSHPGMRIINESNVAATTWGYPRNGMVAMFEHEDTSTGQLLRTDLWVYPFFSRNWALRYVITYSKNDEATARSTDFMKAVPLNVPSE